MFTIHATKKLLDRVKAPVIDRSEEPDTVLGNWYANAIFWKPQVALFVNERTFLPVLVPLAPASSVAARLPDALGEILEAIDVDPSFMDVERLAMDEAVYAKTSNRQVVGVMNEFIFSAPYYREAAAEGDLLSISLKLATTPVGPLRNGNSCPDIEVKKMIEAYLATGRIDHVSPVPIMKRMDAPPDLDLERIRRYAASKTPARLINQMRVEVEVRDYSATLYEARAPWSPDIGPEWTRVKIARLTFHATRQNWKLSWSDSDGRWHPYNRVRAGSVTAMLEEIEDDPTFIFWG